MEAVIFLKNEFEEQKKKKRERNKLGGEGKMKMLSGGRLWKVGVQQEEGAILGSDL